MKEEYFRKRIEQLCADEGRGSVIAEMADFLQRVLALAEEAVEGRLFEQSFEELQGQMEELYRPLLPDNYEKGILYPPRAREILGEKTGQILSALYADLMAAIPYAIRGEEEKLALLCRLFLVCEEACEAVDRGYLDPCDDEERAASLRERMGDFYLAHADAFVRDSALRMIRPGTPGKDPICRICQEADLSDLRYLFRYGSYIGYSEIEMASFLNQLPEEEIEKLAATYVGGYCKGFEAAGKDLRRKRTVKVEYPIGMERVIRKALELFAKEGLAATFVPESVLSLTGRGGGKRGVYGVSPNRQFDFDHKDDLGLYLSEALNQARLTALEEVLSECRKDARAHGGPAVVEIFGEKPFTPKLETVNYRYTEEQNRQIIDYSAKNAEITNRFMPREERSFTIIAFPIPEIGENFPEIFRKIVEVNTLDYELYQGIQQKLIDALDQGTAVRVRGREGNATDILVRLHELSDPAEQSNFENCVADVNIPVGEVFTSPVLEGTSGTLFVSHVYLGTYEYHDLKLEFEDGFVTDYSCVMPEEDGESGRKRGRSLIRDHVFHHHATLPIGEFAIGTNTTAYRLARDYHLEAKLPILIMEKTGPHFAVGDTCYSYEEDVAVFNPDGKECVARENSCSVRRSAAEEEERKKAYFHCHTDITIPFDELDSIVVICADGREIPIIREGRFVLPGTEPLNEALD